MGPHLAQRRVGIAGLEVDASDRIFQDADSDSAAQGVEARCSDAVVRREAAHEELFGAEFVERRFEIATSIRQSLEGRIRILLGVHALREDERGLGDDEIRMKASPLRALNAVRRPGASELLEVFRYPGMPVSSENQGKVSPLEQGDRPVHLWDNRVPVRHSEGAAGTKVILYVDDEQGLRLTHGLDPAIRATR